jgi:hypothetical protein
LDLLSLKGWKLQKKIQVFWIMQQGTSNFNAKGSHRLKFTLTLAKVALDSAEDTNFVELLRIKNGALEEKARNTQYSVLGETLARRTYDESGDYTVRSFDIDIRETLNDGLNNGVYDTGQSTDSGNTASDNFVTFKYRLAKHMFVDMRLKQSLQNLLTLLNLEPLKVLMLLSLQLKLVTMLL